MAVPDCEVMIIGAGLSGLQAARRLADRHDVVVLEARERVGGRAFAHRFANGDTVDLGGQWVGPGQRRLVGLIEELGATTYPLWNEGEHLVAAGGRLKRYTGTIPSLPVHVLLDLNRMLSKFEKMAAEIDVAEPWAHARAKEWDRRTVADFMDKTGFTAAAKQMFAIGIGAVFCAEPHELSLLHALFYAKAGGSLDALLSVEDGAQQDRVHGDMAGLAEAMTGELGDRVRLGAPARVIRWSGDGVRVETDDGAYTAKRLVLALPPNQALGIRFDPALPSSRDALWRRMPAGACIKCVAQYERPFWRDEGLSGQAVGGAGPVHVAFDNSEAGREAGLLLGFIEGDQARVWSNRDPDDRRAAVLDSFAVFFGDQAREPIDYADRDWTAEEFTRGCYAAFMGPGVWTTLGPELRQPMGPIHVAGTETAREGYGYFEGALEAAERAAREVKAALATS
ncbi:amine oxidase [Marinicauda salina]|uniref:Amine oxidase n=1 Tax=Marinicauda salina TaxID=2135793 RepID=A0A2U2BVB0_9PROT|nr:FAD-dependent oxidoreductase [Marinicauda salina]PWE17904.1 amine oxidase [Marinicauda salina]